MRDDSNFLIPFTGLKIGTHQFNFEVDDLFFEERDYSILKKGELCIDVTLEKKETMMIVFFFIKGQVSMPCNRCTENVEHNINTEYKLIYTFGDEDLGDDGIVVLPSSSFELNISQQLYEFITISVPSRVVHDERECNEEMIAVLNNHLSFERKNDNNADDVDPRWEALKGLN
tara:strand:+ start:58 stop:576 length:519 start_codon:yes stop_codon:yes gene_type:complete